MSPLSGTDSLPDDDCRAAGLDDSRIILAIGEELRRARDSLGWSRAELVKRLSPTVPVNTYACYEKGIRQCSIPRLVEICRALGVAASELLGLALQRARVDLQTAGVQVDLHKVLDDDQEGLEPLRRWARNRLETDLVGRGVAWLEWDLIKELAMFFDVAGPDLVNRLMAFTPEVTPTSTANIRSARARNHV